MTNVTDFLRDERDYDQAAHDIASSVYTDRRLPDQVFKVRSQHFRLFDFDEVFEQRFWELLVEVAVTHGDLQVTLGVVDPDPTYFKRHFGYFGAAILSVTSLSAEYQSLFSREPDDSPADALRHNSNVIAFCSGSHRWAVWAQRDLGIGSVTLGVSPNSSLSLNGGRIRLYSAEEALESLVAPNFVTTGIPRTIAESLRRNCPP